MEKVILMILDGWGIPQNPKVSAIDLANTPFVDSLYKKYPHSHLNASGLAVGLPDGQMGNSEVGHMNIGAGRIVYQDLVKINQAFEKKEINQDKNLLKAFQYAKENNKNIHLIGLVSDGGVHSHINHLKGLCDVTKEQNFDRAFIHVFTDGRDTDPQSGLSFVEDLQKHIKDSKVQIASLIGRYYAMDRDKRWERVKLAYDLLVKGEGEETENVLESIQKSYEAGVTDEFIKPIKVKNTPNIKEGDVVLCFNFRTDRGREITQVLTQADFPDFGMKKLSLHYITLTNYDDTFENVKVIFDKDNLSNTLGEVLAKAGKKQIRIAETEKYPHVTFFFSGGREEPFEGEKRILCPSPKVATYDLKPEMSAYEITEAICPELEKREADFICLNFANPDMVGHTGSMEAAIKACETVDKCTEKVVKTALANNYHVIIIADHGNADYMVNEDGSPNTAHTTNLVPCILVSNNLQHLKLKNGVLANVAPTILDLMDIPKSSEMNEESLLVK
ncbi:MAG: 2,3-bisphosphoglycerate-independent phosphoglycerate mutase [Raineya sp.]|jgi:2,3-bisphosphoglycerate-independent phosphoglycerate mutase|nr:2,3-bisphosphoglycerate-independent phosphoglycerate mutase [Raineya sp.]